MNNEIERTLQVNRVMTKLHILCNIPGFGPTPTGRTLPDEVINARASSSPVLLAAVNNIGGDLIRMDAAIALASIGCKSVETDGKSVDNEDAFYAAQQNAYDELDMLVKQIQGIQDNIANVSLYPSAKRCVAEFLPQIVVIGTNDIYESEVEYDRTMDITDEVMRLGQEAALKLRDRDGSADYLKDLIYVQRWIRDWEGPYEVTCEEAIREFFGVTEDEDGEDE